MILASCPLVIRGRTMSFSLYKEAKEYSMEEKGYKETKSGKMVKKNKKGGFPDLTGDGKVTFKDVLKGRGVIKK